MPSGKEQETPNNESRHPLGPFRDTGTRFCSKDLQHADETAWVEWKYDRAVRRHLHVVTCVPDNVEDEVNEREHWRTITSPPDANPADWESVKQTDAIRTAIEDRLVAIAKGTWHDAAPL